MHSRTKKILAWSIIIAVGLVALAAGLMYVQTSRIPASYGPARLTASQKKQEVKRFWNKFLGEFNDGVQGLAAFEWTVSQEQVNCWLASIDEIAASRPDGRAGEVYEAMDQAGLAEPAVAFGDGVITLMIRSTEHNKIFSADLSFSMTDDRKLQVSLSGARVGRLDLPRDWVRQRVSQVKEMLGRNGLAARDANADEEGGGVSPEDVAQALSQILAAVDEKPISTEFTWPISKNRVLVEDVTISDGQLRLRLAPMPGRKNKR